MWCVRGSFGMVDLRECLLDLQKRMRMAMAKMSKLIHAVEGDNVLMPRINFV